MNDMRRIAVVIVNYNTRDLLKRCLEHLLRSETDATLDTFVVDNGSQDGSAAMVAERYPNVTLIESGQNLGFSKANNLALREIMRHWRSQGEPGGHCVLLLNSDCFVEPDTLQVTAAFLDDHEDAGVVGPKVVMRDGALDLACRRAFPRPASAFWKLIGLAKLFPQSPRFAAYNLTYLDPDETAEVDSVMGAYMMVRMEAIRDAGLLDESFFMYGEDLDWSYRLKEHTWRVFYHPAAKVLHYKGATSSRQSYRLIVEFYRAMYLFHRKHYAPETFFLVNWAVTAGIIARGAFALLRNLARPRTAKRVA
jgi:N-acetylglucosaminyl-diphospho-decaprenol L-rhamnosyltransferase